MSKCYLACQIKKSQNCSVAEYEIASIKLFLQFYTDNCEKNYSMTLKYMTERDNSCNVMQIYQFPMFKNFQLYLLFFQLSVDLFNKLWMQSAQQKV